MMRVHPVADHVDAVGMRNPLREHASDERRVVGEFVGLVGVDQELEAPDPVRDGDRHVRSLGIRADLAVRMAQWIIRDVDHQPPRR